MDQKDKKIVVFKKGEHIKNQKPQPKQENIFAPLIGKRIIIQAKSSTIFEGELIDFTQGFFVLKDAKILGRKRIAETDLLYIHQGNVAHLHILPKNIIDRTENKESSS
jgi:hypothetical protein